MALGMFKVIAGDFATKGDHQYANGIFHLKSDGKFFRENIPESDIEVIEETSEEQIRTAGGSIGWGIAGAVVAGPLGAVAAGLIGGKKDAVTFICKFKDGRKFIGVIPRRDFEKIMAPRRLAEI
ncbi:hypothetical protein ACW9UR_23870 [Halovulum sp. GXIMD14794]